MKILAFYLPQFHEIPENNEWWGKGFTDWTNVKKATQLVKGQYQPRKPLNDNYYDLLDLAVMKWQSKIAQEHGIYGFCYYHYWFNGKLLLEKPLENMLKDKEVTIPFCFSWANEPWARTWDGQNTNVLMAQDYGTEEDWKLHFQYLLPFFQDERYIKLDNKPMFLIYRTENIPNVNEMISYWNELAIENSFNGIYLIETLNSFQKKSYVDNSEALVEFEPMYTISGNGMSLSYRIYDKLLKIFINKGLASKSYDHVWKTILNRSNRSVKKKVYLGAFFDWDNTARKVYRGLFFRNMTLEKFRYYFKHQINKAKQQNSEFIFFNAWNEWAEGTYLEPDKKYKFKILETIKDVVGFYKKND
ncbi:glycosyltransferase WbsX family protein [Sulfurimonas microaerophilic]|uniref:glycosyltransferase WbsX family protein n=1 Tax=Sulfurimonas microaerophilic TaxID=3058392 RepID=UPI002714CA55|nr:glycoside hydrolase family 99-like domain-containing protein [Sulfurimonas sp. hsl 1-7]